MHVQCTCGTHQGLHTLDALARSKLSTSSMPTFLPASSASFHVRISCTRGGGQAGRQDTHEQPDLGSEEGGPTLGLT